MKLLKFVGLFVMITFVVLVGCSKKGEGDGGANKQSPTENKQTPQQSSLKQRMEASYKKAADWLVSKQGSDGTWKAGNFPSVGYTAMVSYALSGASPDVRKSYETAISKAIGYVISKQGEDGSFSDEGFNKTYITSIVVMSLASADKDKYADAIKRAQTFLVGGQQKSGIYKGGAGYGDIEAEMKDGKFVTKKRERADMSNTSFAMEALKASGLPEDSPYWKDAVEFLAKCQNSSETNTDPELMDVLAKAGIKIGNDGGFVYSPDYNQAGEETYADASKYMRSYGSMTYAGIKSFLYANVDKNDERVKAAVEWAKNHYTLDVNAGMPADKAKQGLFYYYTTFSKAMGALGVEEFEDAKGEKHKWAEELVEKLISLQTAEGGSAWKNESPRWSEGDPVLATSYAIMTYNTIRKWIK